MKKAVFIVFFISFSLLSFAQESPSKNEKNSIEVLGNCDMCKKRIEKAAFSVKGVKYASWDNSSGQLRLIYNGLKTDIQSKSKSLLQGMTLNTTTHLKTYMISCLLVVSMFGKGKNPNLVK
ncbi:MAG: heavy-metal-associated domain-containing protein [Flavobacteriaceae bacterium]